jgi:hypothetical protein
MKLKKACKIPDENIFFQDISDIIKEMNREFEKLPGKHINGIIFEKDSHLINLLNVFCSTYYFSPEETMICFNKHFFKGLIKEALPHN